MGATGVGWLLLGKILTYLQLTLSVLTSFYKPDFLTGAAVVIAIYFFHFPDKIRKKDFRYLTGVLAVSIVYDLFWIFFITDYHM